MDKSTAKKKLGPMIAKAVHKNAHISPQKVRLVVDAVRRLSASDALNRLTFLKKKAAVLIKKVLESAIANAEHNKGADVDELFVSAIYVDDAMKLRRMSPRAKGRSDIKIKRFSHITVEVANQA